MWSLSTPLDYCIVDSLVAKWSKTIGIWNGMVLTKLALSVTLWLVVDLLGHMYFKLNVVQIKNNQSPTV